MSARTDTWRPHVEKAIAFIAAHLERPLSLEEVARVANLSAFHFHRIFSAVTGEAVGRFITRQRLERGALLLAYERQSSITDIALRCGYSSVSNFSKAFSAWFGCSPREVRSPRGAMPAKLSRLRSTTGRVFDPRALYTPPTPPKVGRPRTPRIEQRAALEVVCLASPEGYDFKSISHTWKRLIRHARALGIAGDAVDAWGMAFDSPTLAAPEHRRYHACVPCPPGVVTPVPLFRGRIPAGRWALFPYEGPVSGVEAHYRELYSVAVPANRLELDDFVAVEHYVNDEPVSGQVSYEVHLKLR